MSEFSIEEKANAYDIALKKAETLLSKCKRVSDKASMIYRAEDIENMFPELKESEDEKLRKEMLQIAKESEDSFYMVLTPNKRETLIALLEKQGEQKSVDKIEPKFKVGDFIANDYCRGKVVELTNDAYLLDTEQGMPFSYEHNIHLWTIEDAKEGDVLSYVTDEEDLWIMVYWSLYKPYKGHVHYHALLINNNFSDKGTCCIDINNLKPATKEQRDLLFAKMHEAGYEWDIDKKELIKL